MCPAVPAAVRTVPGAEIAGPAAPAGTRPLQAGALPAAHETVVSRIRIPRSRRAGHGLEPSSPCVGTPRPRPGRGTHSPPAGCAARRPRRTSPPRTLTLRPRRPAGLCPSRRPPAPCPRRTAPGPPRPRVLPHPRASAASGRFTAPAFCRAPPLPAAAVPPSRRPAAPQSRSRPRRPVTPPRPGTGPRCTARLPPPAVLPRPRSAARAGCSSRAAPPGGSAGPVQPGCRPVQPPGRTPRGAGPCSRGAGPYSPQGAAPGAQARTAPSGVRVRAAGVRARTAPESGPPGPRLFGGAAREVAGRRGGWGGGLVGLE